MVAAVFVPFLYELRRRKVPVGAQEAVALAEALGKGLHQSSLDGFYHVARAILIHNETHLDAFDEAFGAHFKGIEVEAKALHKELLDWLADAVAQQGGLSEEERRLLEKLDPEELRRMFEERLREQTERHDGGNRWIGTGGTSPFGHSGAAREGIRVGGQSKNRSAIQVADARLYKGYRSDLTLDIRQMAVALRKLRAFAREGAEDELDLEGTIAATSANAGELELKLRPPRRSNTRVILMMDIGGSMDPYAHLVSRLFTAASKATHFKELRTYYFHNCVYGEVYKTENFRDPVRLSDLFHECGKHYKLVMVGDALMAPYELLARGGSLAYGEENRVEGLVWLTRLTEHFERHVWLNPEPRGGWHGNTIEMVRRIFPMFALTLDGLSEAVGHLVKAQRARI